MAVVRTHPALSYSCIMNAVVFQGTIQGHSPFTIQGVDPGPPGRIADRGCGKKYYSQKLKKIKLCTEVNQFML